MAMQRKRKQAPRLDGKARMGAESAIDLLFCIETEIDKDTWAGMLNKDVVNP